jgi:RsmE family RNA methyltransferase
VVVVGPEGGFVDHEIAAFTERGFLPADLGPWVLRTETAVVAALAQLGLLARARGLAGAGGAGGEARPPC